MAGRWISDLAGTFRQSLGIGPPGVRVTLDASLASAARAWQFPNRSDTFAGLAAQTFTGLQTAGAGLLAKNTLAIQAVGTERNAVVIRDNMGYDMASIWSWPAQETGGLFNDYAYNRIIEWNDSNNTATIDADYGYEWTANAIGGWRFNVSAISINMSRVAGNGALQLAAGTTKASGIAFGTDTWIYRSGPDELRLPTYVLTGGDAGAGDAVLGVGYGRAAAGAAMLSLYGNTGGGWAWRANAAGGPNGQTVLTHTGTGDYAITAQDAAAIVLRTNSTIRASISATGGVNIGPTAPGTAAVPANGLRVEGRTEATIQAGVACTGTASRSGSTVTGSGTLFLSELKPGDLLVMGSSNAQAWVRSIASDTSLTTYDSGTIASGAVTKYSPAFMSHDATSGDAFIFGKSSSGMAVIFSNANRPALSVWALGVTSSVGFQVKVPLSTDVNTGKAFFLGVPGETADRLACYSDGKLGMGGGTTGRDIFLFRQAANAMGVAVDPHSLTNLGASFNIYGTLKIKEGTNAAMGVATLVAGTVTVNTTKVTANSRIFLQAQDAPSGPHALHITARTAGTSFTITSSSGADTSAIAWMIVEPAP